MRALAAAAVLAVSACGGSDGDGGSAGAPNAGSGDDEPIAAAAPTGPLGGIATFTVDGTDIAFTMDPVEYSPTELMSDVTFETCSANFFGVGMFRAIGYPVDANGELLVAESGDIAGSVDMIIPPHDWESRGLDDGEPQVTIKSDALEGRLKMAGPDQAAELAPDAQHSWVITDNGVSGTAVFTDVRQGVHVVDFEATCR